MPEGIDENPEGDQFKVEREADQPEQDQESESASSDTAVIAESGPDMGTGDVQYPAGAGEGEETATVTALMGAEQPSTEAEEGVESPDEEQAPDNATIADKGVLETPDGPVQHKHAVKEGDYSNEANIIQDPAYDSKYFVKTNHVPGVNSRGLPTPYRFIGANERLDADEARVVASAMEADEYFPRKSEKLGAIMAKEEGLKPLIDDLSSKYEELYEQKKGLEWGSDESRALQAQIDELREKQRKLYMESPDRYDAKIAREDIGKTANRAENGVLEFFRLNPERFGAMSAGEFIEMAGEFEALKSDKHQAEMRAEWMDKPVKEIGAVITEGTQKTANELLESISNMSTVEGKYLQTDSEDSKEIIAAWGEIQETYLDVSPRETYRKCLELAQKVQEALRKKATRLENEISSMTDAAKQSPDSEPVPA